MELHRETIYLVDSLIEGHISEEYFDALVESGLMDNETLRYALSVLEEGLTFEDVGLKSMDKSAGARGDTRVQPGEEQAKEIAKEALNDYIDKAVPSVTQEKSVEPKADKLSKILADKMSKTIK